MDRLHPRNIYWFVFLLALGVRLAYVLQIHASPLFEHPAVDGETYSQHAERLAAGNWLGRGEGPFWQPPLYPYFLGLIKTLFPESFFHTARYLQALLGALSCVLVYWLGRQMFQPPVSAIAALAAVLYGPLIFFDGELLPASLATFLDLSGLGLLLRSLRRESTWGLMCAGLVFGLAALTVATVLSFVLGAAGWICWHLYRRALPLPQVLGKPGIFLVGSMLAIAPVSLRNYAVGKDTVLISYNAGVNFYIGNNPDYDSRLNVRPGWEWDDLIGMPGQAGIERASIKSRFFLATSWDYIHSRPLDYLGLLARKLFLFWHGDEIGRNQDIYFWRNYSSVLAATLWKKGIAFPFGIVGPLALLGLLLAVRQQGLSLPLVFVVVYCLSIIAFFVTARYRIPLLPPLLLFAAYGGHWLYACLRQPGFKSAGLPLAACAAFAIPANYQVAPMDMQGNAAIHYNLGNALAQAGQRHDARREFEQAVALDSTYWQAWFNLGSLRGAQGDMPDAVRIFERVAQAHPERPEVWLNLAHAHLALNARPASLRAYEHALRADPEQRRVYVELIALYLQGADFPRAERVLEQALKHYPQDEKRFRHMYERTKARMLAR